MTDREAFRTRRGGLAGEVDHASKVFVVIKGREIVGI